MATARLTFGSILGTINDTATAASDLVKTAGNGIGIVNKFVESAAIDQKDRQVIHRKTFRDQLLRDSRITIARSNKEVLDFTQESEENAKLYAAAEEYLPDNIFGE